MVDTDLAKRHPILKRLIEAAYEIGILQITFSPLDWVFESHSGKGEIVHVIFFASIGVFLLFGSIFAEWLLTHGQRS